MISLRAHLVTLVAVFLALAVGVALGGGPLADAGPDDDRALATGAPEVPGSGAGDAFAAAVAPKVLRNRLEDRSVAVVSLPGADDEVLDALGDRITDAGGRVVGRYAVAPTLLEPGEKQLVDSLGRQLITEYAKKDLDRSAPPYERLGGLLALSLASTDRSGDQAGSRASSLLANLTGAGVATAEGEPRKRAPLVLVVLGDDPVDVVLPPADRATGEVSADDVATTEAATDAVLVGLLAGLRRDAAGVLLAGSSASGADGALSRVREDDQLADVTTLDGVETTVGQVSVALALSRALDGAVGDHGASGPDGAVPLG